MTHVPSGGLGRKGGYLTCMQLRTVSTVGNGEGEEEKVPFSHWGMLSHTCHQCGTRRRGSVPCKQWGMGKERRRCIFPSGGLSVTPVTSVDWEEEDLCHLHSAGFLHMSLVRDGGGEEDLCYIVGGVWSHTYPVTNGNEDYLSHICCGGLE